MPRYLRSLAVPRNLRNLAVQAHPAPVHGVVPSDSERHASESFAESLASDVSHADLVTRASTYVFTLTEMPEALPCLIGLSHPCV